MARSATSIERSPSSDRMGDHADVVASECARLANARHLENVLGDTFFGLRSLAPMNEHSAPSSYWRRSGAELPSKATTSRVAYLAGTPCSTFREWTHVSAGYHLHRRRFSCGLAHRNRIG